MFLFIQFINIGLLLRMCDVVNYECMNCEVVRNCNLRKDFDNEGVILVLLVK